MAISLKSLTPRLHFSLVFYSHFPCFPYYSRLPSDLSFWAMSVMRINVNPYLIMYLSSANDYDLIFCEQICSKYGIV